MWYGCCGICADDKIKIDLIIESHNRRTVLDSRIQGRTFLENQKAFISTGVSQF